ncbi:MAG: AAA family ATPase, partial [Natronospirillum sp.]
MTQLGETTGTGLQVPGYQLETLLHLVGQRVVYNAVRLSDGLPVVIKTLDSEYPDKQQLAGLRREYHTLHQLRDVEGVIAVLGLESFGNGNQAIVMERFGRSLSAVLADRQPLSLSHFFHLARQLITTLDGVHQCGMIHKDINPANILIDSERQNIRLIDCGLTSELSLERQFMASLGRLEGSLPYISPEQSGRMNRDLDYRSDYYSLGVTCFVWLTGQLPFEAGDALEWVHCHLSKLPPAPASVNRELPRILSDLVLKLMAKNPHERYQSAFGLLADLQRCQHHWLATGTLGTFELGLSDVSRQFQIPQKLYGRDRELAELMTLFDLVSDGSVELCMVSGYSGMGKSALVKEISVPLIRERGYLVQGKFDQYQNNRAYQALTEAFRSLMLQLLAEPSERLAQWRETLLDALGGGGQLLIDEIPELALIISEQDAVSELPPVEAQNRFQLLFVKFVQVFATAEHPLVIFIDDLQWSDIPTLHLLQRLISSRELNHLLMLGAYRSNEVKSGHPLRLALNDIGKSRQVHHLRVPPLDQSAIRELVIDTLTSRQSGDDLAPVHALADFLNEVTEG